MDSLDRTLDRIEAALTPYGHRAGDVFRWGLGVSMLLGGGYKILEPAVYQAYFAPLFASLWPEALVPLDLVFVLAGAFELVFGLLLLARWRTPVVAGLTAPWLLGTNVNFVVAVAQGESSVDLLALYVALMMMAVGVALDGTRAHTGGGAETAGDVDTDHPAEASASQ